MISNNICFKCLDKLPNNNMFGSLCENCYVEKLNEDSIPERDEPVESSGKEIE